MLINGEFLGGPPLSSSLTTDETTASTAYAALTNPISVDIPLTGNYGVELAADMYSDNGTTIAQANMSYDIGVTPAVDA